MPTSPPIERLVASLRRLPGIGEKSATRLAFFLLSAPDALTSELADAILQVKREIVLCEDCFGRYHVLGGTLSPIDGVGPENLRIAELEKRIRSGSVREVILATNPNAEGDATAHYIAEQLRPTGVQLTLIYYGMPMGGDLEYADQVT